MQHYTDIQWLDTRLDKLKLYLAELKNNLVHLEPQYKSLRPRFLDVECYHEDAESPLDNLISSFRGLEPRIRNLRSLSQKLLVFGLIVLFIVPWVTFLRRTVSSSATRKLELDNSVFNATLGFQEVFALALPDRSDRVQPLLDAANATNINVTILEAVRDRQIPEDARPIGWSEHPSKKVGELGCLMSHVRTWRKMIAENIESALIMESDADWDLHIKEVMQGVATASKRLLDWPFDAPTRPGHFPYGDKWDVVWIGHCGAYNHETHRIYSFNDTSVPPEDYEFSFTEIPLPEQHRPGTRTVFPLGFAVCTTAYAISNAGAIKLEKELRVGSDNVDLRMAQICRENQGVNCLAVWPQPITAAITEPNIQHPIGESVTGTLEVNGWYPGQGLQYSARLNAESVLKGSSMEEWEPQWNSTWAMKNETWTQVSFEEAKKLEAEAKADAEERGGKRTSGNGIMANIQEQGAPVKDAQSLRFP